MSFSFKRKHLVFAGLAISLAAAIYLNWYYTRPASQQPEIPQEEAQEETRVNLGDAQFVNARAANDLFSDAILNRSKAQGEAKQNYEEILADKSIDEKTRSDAQEALKKLNDNIIAQSEIETLIKAKSSGEVFVSLGGTAEVILEKGTLTDELCIQVKDIIVRKTGIAAEKITIIEAK